MVGGCPVCCQGLKVLSGGAVVEGPVGSEVVELVGEGVDPAVDSVEVVVGEIPCRVEPVSPCAVVALDMSVEFGGSGREFEEADAPALAFAFGVGFEPGAAIDPDGLDGEGHGFLEFVEEAFGVVCGCPSPGLCACPPGYKAFGVWENAPPAKAEAACLQSRAVGAHGLRAADRDRLIVPVRDAGGALMSLQFISPDGKKRLMAGGRKDGGMHVIEARGGRGDGPIIVAEGYATAATLGEASGHTAVCAFDAGNLRAVAEALRAKHPQRAIVMAADDDRAKRGRGNVGLNRARDAARAVGGKVVEPGFTDAERAKGMTDFNDLARARGVEAVRAALAPALAGDRKRAAPARAAEDERGLAMAG